MERACLTQLFKNFSDFSLAQSIPRQSPDKSAIALLDLLRRLSSKCVRESGYGCQKHRF